MGWIQDRRAIAAVAAVAAGLIVQLVWVVIRASLAVGPQPDQGVGVPFSRTAAFLELFKFFPGVADGALRPESVGHFGAPVAAVLTALIAAGVIGLAVRAPAASHEQLFGTTVLIVSVAAAPLLAIANVIVGGFYFVLPARYGTALLPAMIACAGLLFTTPDKRWLPAAVAALGLLTFGLSLGFTEG